MRNWSIVRTGTTSAHKSLFFKLRRLRARIGEALQTALHQAIRVGVSPRFLPDQTIQAPEVPRTLTGKKQELPIKKLLLGQPIERVLNRDAMANPGCLDWYQAFSDRYNQPRGAAT